MVSSHSLQYFSEIQGTDLVDFFLGFEKKYKRSSRMLLYEVDFYTNVLKCYKICSYFISLCNR